MNSSFDQVVASYHRARLSGQLFDTFYHLFLAKSPEIPPMFARTDFPHQKLMLRRWPSMILNLAPRSIRCGAMRCAKASIL